jgi:hypothetical protein
MIGWLAALNTAGSVVFLMAGTPLIYHLGSIRSLQMGMAVGMIGVLMLTLPLDLAALAGSFLMGLCYGPSVSGGGDILQRLSPPQHCNLLFSAKQAGVPLAVCWPASVCHSPQPVSAGRALSSPWPCCPS